MAPDEHQLQPVACTRCGHQPLRHVTSIPRRFDQASAFAVLHCESCGHLQWVPQPAASDGTL